MESTKRQIMIDIAKRLVYFLEAPQSVNIIDEKHPNEIIKVLDINTNLEVSTNIDLLKYIDSELK